MLSTLRIKNLALVEDLTLELAPGFNTLTGETGAGKSIILGALNLVLGERADRTLIRAGADGCVVEAVFDTRGLRAPLGEFLVENGLEPCEDNSLVLRRAFSAAGANRQFINGSPATLATLAAVGQWLVDMHGPHDHQSLLQPARQRAILDAFGGLEAEGGAFAALARRRAALLAERAALVVDEQTYARQLDLLRFQSQEIAAAQLRAEEEAELGGEFQRSRNGARLAESGRLAQEILTEAEPSLLSQMGALGRALGELRRLDAAAAPLAESQEQAAEVLRELQLALSRYTEHLDTDPARLAQVEERLNLIHSLQRKYGTSVADVIAFGQDAAAKLAALESRDGELARIAEELAKTDAALDRAGRALTAARRKVIPKLVKAAVRQLGDLGFAQSRMDIALTSETGVAAFAGAVPSAGFDTVEFQFAPNPGEPARPLRAIASSGEMARVMLALKTVLAAQDEIPVLVFDEVDANVGGETAAAVGDKMRQIAARRQVLCITHLAPVAAAAGAHYVVSKRVKGGRTLTDIARVEDAARVEELARMLGGGAAARKHAEALVK